MILELIETLWNVNKGVYVFDFSDNGELIETLWNVNFLVVLITDSIGTSELIETLWNVNNIALMCVLEIA